MNKPPIQKPKGPLGKMTFGVPWECLATDFIGPLYNYLHVVTSKGNRYILVVMDFFTKLTEAFPVPDQTATVTAKVLLNEMCSLLHIKKTRTTARNPKCKGGGGVRDSIELLFE